MPFYDIYEDSQRDVPPLPFYLGGRLLPVKGKMEICGAPGIMKSFLALGLGFSFATGQPWLGFSTTQVRTALAHFEMSYEVEHERHTEMSRVYELEPGFFYGTNKKFTPLDIDSIFTSFKDEIAQLEPRILILDYWRCCYAGDENKAHEVARFTSNMDAMIEELNLSIVLLHHSNKNPLYVSGLDKHSGSVALPGWMDSVLYIVKQPSGLQLQFPKTRHYREGNMPSINIAMENMLWVRR